MTFGVGPHHGAWTDVRTGALEMMEEPTSRDLGPWEFRILEG